MDFAKLTIYMETCESGSMFDNLLLSNVTIYATSVAYPSPSEPYYACYYDPIRRTYLGDVYSIN